MHLPSTQQDDDPGGTGVRPRRGLHPPANRRPLRRRMLPRTPMERGGAGGGVASGGEEFIQQQTGGAAAGRYHSMERGGKQRGGGAMLGGAIGAVGQRGGAGGFGRGGYSDTEMLSERHYDRDTYMMRHKNRLDRLRQERDNQQQGGAGVAAGYQQDAGYHQGGGYQDTTQQQQQPWMDNQHHDIYSDYNRDQGYGYDQQHHSSYHEQYPSMMDYNDYGYQQDYGNYPAHQQNYPQHPHQAHQQSSVQFSNNNLMEGGGLGGAGNVGNTGKIFDICIMINDTALLFAAENVKAMYNLEKEFIYPGIFHQKSNGK